MSNKKPNSTPDLGGSFAQKTGRDLPGLMRWLGSFFNSASTAATEAPIQANDNAHHAHHVFSIEQDKLLELVRLAINARRIEPYQASLLVAANMSEPLRYNGKEKNWEQFLVSLIELHNNGPMTFNAKRRTLLNQIAPDRAADFDRLDRAGLTINTNPGHAGVHRDTKREVYIDRRSNDEVNHTRQPRPEDINSSGVMEGDVNGTLIKTYSAIPKKHLKPLILEAMRDNRMVPAQAAFMIAVNCHAMKLRKFSKVRYLDHVLGVAGDANLTPNQRIVAVLHDVLEDSNWTAKDLLEIGMPEGIVKSLQHITKNEDELVYLHFIERVSLDADALAVKIADIRHNMKDADAKKAPKYRLALNYLLDVQIGSTAAGSSIEDYARKIKLYDPKLFVPEDKKNEASRAAPMPPAPPPMPFPPAPAPA